MRRIIGVVLLLAVLVVMSALPVLAGGGQVRGDNGQGAVVQVQTQDPPPFRP